MKPSNYRLDDIKNKLYIAGFQPLDVMITGVTGSGKSTTLNALFNQPVAKIGEGIDPETMDIQYYQLNVGLRFWDTPGLGDSKERDKIHSKAIVDSLNKCVRVNGKDHYKFIDLVIVVIEATKKDLGTVYKLIEQVLLHNIDPKRVLIAVNQADFAMNGLYWNKKIKEPQLELVNYLEDFVDKLKLRIEANMMPLQIPRPIYYSALYGYNMDKFMDLIIDNIPRHHRNLNE